MRIVHIIPGLDAGAPQTLKDEHARALESISAAVANFARADVRLRAVLVHDPSWPVPHSPGIETYAQEIDYITVPKLSGIRPKLRSFFAEALIEATDYVIFTNSDICVTPNFYEVVCELITDGTTAGSIHRKTIMGVSPSGPESLAEAIDSVNWYLHPGSDCFFFTPAVARQLRQSELVMGVPPVGRHTIAVMSAMDPGFRKFEALGITFHFGDDQIWKLAGPLQRLTRINYRAWQLSLPGLLRVVGLKGFVRAMATARISTLSAWLRLAWSVLNAGFSRLERRRP